LNFVPPPQPLTFVMAGQPSLPPSRATGPIRALVVGAGETSALLHLPALARLRDRGRVELVEICDLRRDRASAAKARFGFARTGGDARSALQNPEIDAVYLFGDARMHHDIGLAAIECGKHLFVEKPVSPSHAEAQELAQAAARRKVIAVGGHNRRFSQALGEVRRRGAKAGWRYAEAVFHKPGFGLPPPFGATSWLAANGIHALDALVYVMGGPPEWLCAAADGERYSALLRWADGAQAVFLCDNEAGERREAYAFHAAGETCRIDDGGLRIAPDAGPRNLLAPFEDGFEAEHAAFVDGVERGVEPPNSLSALVPSLKLAELIEAGFSGRIEWCEPPGIRAAESKSSEPGSMLIVNPEGLTAALAAKPPRRPLVTLDDVLRSATPRPDIVAALIGAGPSVLTADILDKLPELRVAGLVGLSFGRHRPDLLLQRGVALVNASAAYADSVAEYAFGLAVLARRRAFASDRVMRRGGWGTMPQPDGWSSVALRGARMLRPLLVRSGVEPALLKIWRRTRPFHGAGGAPPSPPRDLKGATVGLIGWGANAQAFATRLLAAGARVSVYSEHASADELHRAGVTPVSLGQALAADIVSLHRGLTPSTRHRLGSEELARLRPGSVLLNVARAGLIEPKALLARLRRGDVFACLDVFEHEPPPAADPLRRLPNVFLTSHIAAGSADTRRAAVDEVLDKIERHLVGAPAEAITRERLRAMT
jgi:phosphoglycerate dehydrogenase-like enzyme/predicted dehydrogenase